MRARIAVVTVVMSAGLLVQATPQETRRPERKPEVSTPSEEEEQELRRFSLTMRYSFTRIPKALEVIDFWFPLPVDDAHQKTFNRVTYAPYPLQMAVDDQTGNRTMYMQGGRRGGVPLQVKISMDVERKERNHDSSAPSEARPPEEVAAIRERWLGSDSGIVIDRGVKSRASKIVGEKKEPLEQARAIFDFVVSEITLIRRPQLLPGSGYGRLDFTLDQMKGTSTDLSAAFVGLCRAIGIPARVVVGMQLPAGNNTTSLTDFHSWVEFWLDEHGWLPADPTQAQRDSSRAAYYFGSIDADRLTLSRGRDVELMPPQAGEPLNFFSRAYWEGDKQPMPAPQTFIEFTGLEEIPPPPAVPVN